LPRSGCRIQKLSDAGVASEHEAREIRDSGPDGVAKDELCGSHAGGH
jgi:hypothetical protein